MNEQNKKAGILGKLFREKLNTGFPEAEENNEMQATFMAEVKEAIEAEKKKMDAMSRTELIEYAAETRIHLVNVQLQLSDVWDAIYTSQQLQLLTIDTVNRIIKKQSVKPIYIPSLEQAKDIAKGKK